MSDLKYTYAVARIRALESSLLNSTIIDQLLACPDAPRGVRLLIERGWGGNEISGDDIEELLHYEEDRTWQVIEEVAPDPELFKSFRIFKLYHNLKAAIKIVCTGSDPNYVFYKNTLISGEEFIEILHNKAFYKLPYNMPAVAIDAYNALLTTRDGQLCDIIIDKASLEAVYQFGKESDLPLIRNFAEASVAIANIRIAVRANQTGKTLEFLSRSLAECDSINIDTLGKAAVRGIDEIKRYLVGTSYAGATTALEESSTAFEVWCDNFLMEILQAEKYKSFSAGPVLAYWLARESEIKTVRIILAGKQNGFSEEEIRERVRVMYV